MINNFEEIERLPYTRILIPNEDGSYSAEILEFPGCFSDGETAEEAMRNLEEAAKSWVEASLALGHDIPEPLMIQDYSGKIALRLPRSLHRQAARMALRDGVSLNQFMVSAISARLGAEDLLGSLTTRFERRSTAVANTNFLRFLAPYPDITIELTGRTTWNGESLMQQPVLLLTSPATGGNLNA